MKKLMATLLLPLLLSGLPTHAAEFVQTPYGEQKVVFDIYLDDPAKLGSALFWLRSYMNPLMDDPYGYAPEFMDIVVIVHGTEIVTLAKKNYTRYKTVVERMKYYSQLGVRFKVCNLAAEDYGYDKDDFYDFVQVVPSAMTELVHWQLQGYALLRPIVMEKKFSIEELR